MTWISGILDFWDFEFPGFWIFGISISGIFNFLNLIFWVFDFWKFLKIFRFFLTNTQKFLVIFVENFFRTNRQISLRSLQKYTFWHLPWFLIWPNNGQKKIAQKSHKNHTKITQKSPKSYTESGIFLCFFWIIFAVPIIFLFTRRWRKSTLNL